MRVYGTVDITIFKDDDTAIDTSVRVICDKVEERLEGYSDRPATYETYYENFEVLDYNLKYLNYVIDESSFVEEDDFNE